MKNANGLPGWQQATTEKFWGEIAPCEHVLQIYENEEIFLEALAGYVGAGINAGDCCIVIATPSHLKALQARLEEHVVYVDALIADERFILLDAEETLSKFMVNDWPDEKKFRQTFATLIRKLRRDSREIRAFGEMVAILWRKGLYEATIRLEELWNKLCKKEKFSLFCAYPEDGFMNSAIGTAVHICSNHSKMIAGSKKQMKEVFYKEIGRRSADKNLALLDASMQISN